MPRIVHVINHEPARSFRVEKIAGMFDVDISHKLTKSWDLNAPIEDKSWNVGLIVGASGSGKTTIANQLFPNKIHDHFHWSKDCLLDDFSEDADVKSIIETLSSVGFSSPPSWLLPYKKLSSGQKFRAELARCLFEYEELFIFDEFTSFVDRQVAQIGAYAFQKILRRLKRQFVAVTCHYDVEGWLEPDWVLDVSTGKFNWGFLQRPPIQYEIQRVNYPAWELFKEHHYLSGGINKSAFCFCGFVDGRPVAFDAWLPFFGRLSHGKGMRGHRTVVLPDFQGLGLGYRLLHIGAQMWSGLGYRVFSNTGHPAEIKKRVENKDWRITGLGRTSADSAGSRVKRADNRLICRSEYVGEKMDREEARRLLND